MSDGGRPQGLDDAYPDDQGSYGDDVRPRRGRFRWLVVVIVTFITTGGFGALLWYAYSQGLRQGSEAVVPLIQAETDPIMVRPEDPGGLEVPFQESVIFDSLDGDPDPDVEQVLPAPEDPVERPEPEVEVATVEPEEPPEPPQPVHHVGPPVTPAPSGVIVREQLLPPPVEETADQEIEQAASTAVLDNADGRKDEDAQTDAVPERILTEPPATVAPVVEDVPSTVRPQRPLGWTGAFPLPKPSRPANQVSVSAPSAEGVSPPSPTDVEESSPVTPDPTATVGGRRIQVGSVRSEEVARSEWARLQRQYPNELGSLDLAVERVDLGERGIFYRIQTQPIARSDADRICSELSRNNAACIVVRR